MKRIALSVVFAVAAVTLAPTAHAGMVLGNYKLDTNRDPGHIWMWSVRQCVDGRAGCVHVSAVPQPNGQAAPYDGEALLSDGRYTLAVDVPDGVRCVVAFFPSRDVYSWDAVTLQGEVSSTFATGCGGAPGGVNTYPFSLVRW